MNIVGAVEAQVSGRCRGASPRNAAIYWGDTIYCFYDCCMNVYELLYRNMNMHMHICTCICTRGACARTHMHMHVHMHMHMHMHMHQRLWCLVLIFLRFVRWKEL